MKRTFAAAVVAVAFSMAAPAQAADFILTDDGQIDAVGPVLSKFFVATSSATSVSANLFNIPGAGAFLDRYIFAPTFLSVGSGAAVTNFQATVTFGTPGLRIDAYDLAAAGAGVTAALIDAFSTGSAASYTGDVGVLTAFLGGAPVPVYSQVGVPALDPNNRQLIGVPLDPANFYVISIDGSAADNDAIYSGNMTLTSVPEPTTWAMMLAGFGLIGFAMRRQRQSHPKVRFAF